MKEMFNKMSWNTHELNIISKRIAALGGTLWVVGGAVRDILLDIPPLDVDLMVSGIEVDKAKSIFEEFGHITQQDLISDPAVFQVDIAGFKFEVAMARGEAEDDARRRDFTINAILFNLISGRILDPFDGISDLKNGIIRAVDPETFVKSTERVLRGIELRCRLDFFIESTTIRLMREMAIDFHTIPVEQIWRRIEKTAMLAIAPEKFITGLLMTNWCEFFPEMKHESAYQALEIVNISSVPHFVAALIADMSSREEKSFFNRIGCPKKIKREAIHIKNFGQWGRPERWVNGRDLDFINPGPGMGKAVNWAFIGQINNIFDNRAEAIAWVKENMEEFND